MKYPPKTRETRDVSPETNPHTMQNHQRASSSTKPPLSTDQGKIKSNRKIILGADNTSGKQTLNLDINPEIVCKEKKEFENTDFKISSDVRNLKYNTSSSLFLSSLSLDDTKGDKSDKRQDVGVSNNAVNDHIASEVLPPAIPIRYILDMNKRVSDLESRLSEKDHNLAISREVEERLFKRTVFLEEKLDTSRMNENKLSSAVIILRDQYIESNKDLKKALSLLANLDSRVKDFQSLLVKKHEEESEISTAESSENNNGQQQVAGEAAFPPSHDANRHLKLKLKVKEKVSLPKQHVSTICGSRDFADCLFPQVECHKKEPKVGSIMELLSNSTTNESMERINRLSRLSKLRETREKRLDELRNIVDKRSVLVDKGSQR